MRVTELRSFMGIGVMRRHKKAESDSHYRQEFQQVFSGGEPQHELYIDLPVTGRSTLRLKIIVAMPIQEMTVTSALDLPPVEPPTVGLF